ncbi:MAG: hypothetical protein GY822_23075 [Deltaproteobacteria bacterium]|nr:hypothetical protein [Deltaproteobacteria bacterium]
MKSLHWLLFVVVTVQLFVFSAQAGGPHSTFGVSARSKGMANAKTGVSNGWEAAFENPAALARLEKGVFSTGLSLSLPDLHLELDTPLAANDPLAPAEVPAYAGNVWGFAFPFRGFLEKRLYFGFAPFFPTEVATHATSYDPARPFVYRYDTYTDHYDVAMGFGLRWFDWFATGVGVRIGGGQSGGITTKVDPLRSRMLFQSMEAIQYTIYAPTAGVTLGPFGKKGVFTVQSGFSFREQFDMAVDVPAFLSFDGLDFDLVVPISTRMNFTPRTFSGGLGVEVLDMLTLSLDVDYRMWSLAPPPFVHVSIQASGSDLDAVGFGGLLDVPGPGQSRVRDVGFVDIFTTRMGAELRLLDEKVAMRMGYGFRPSPVPDQTSGTNIADAATHIVAAGLGIHFDLPFLDEDIRLDMSWQTHILQPRVAEKDIVDDPVGNWTLSGFVHEGSLQISYFF